LRKLIKYLYKFKLLKRLIPSLLKLIVKIFKIKKIKIKHNNLYLLLNPKNPIDREVYLKDCYEKNQISFLEKEIDKNNIDIFIDIGAHMGFYSINLSKKKIKIYSFEPIKNNYNQFKENILINKIDNITSFNCALSNKKSIIQMWVPDENKTGGFTIFNIQDEALKKYKSHQIHYEHSKANLGDNLLNFKQKKIAIKIDVERHEEQVIMGITKLLKNNKIIIQIEIFDERKEKIFKLMNDRKYHLFNSIEKDYFFTNFEAQNK
jgi:FkbM family methyltransferase